MIGTTSVEESSGEILYPSISVCHDRKRGYFYEQQDISIFQRPLNLSEIILSLKMFQMTESGDIQVVTTRNVNLKNRDNNCHQQCPKIIAYNWITFQ